MVGGVHDPSQLGQSARDPAVLGGPGEPGHRVACGASHSKIGLSLKTRAEAVEGSTVGWRAHVDTAPMVGGGTVPSSVLN